MEKFLACLCVYYIASAILAAISRLLLAIPYFFIQFCTLHTSPFEGAWQQYDFPFRAAQSMLQHHTRTQNIHKFAFAESLLDATRPQRQAAMQAAAQTGKVVVAPALLLQKPELIARNRWLVAYTLVRNPHLSK